MQWEVGIAAHEDTDEVLLEDADNALGGVATMIVRRSKLEVDVLVGKIVFEGLRAFVVEA